MYLGKTNLLFREPKLEHGFYPCTRPAEREKKKKEKVGGAFASSIVGKMPNVEVDSWA